MGHIKPPYKAKLFTALLSKDEGYFSVIREKLSVHFGPVDFTTTVSPWTHSKYYEKEMGAELLRVFFFFERPFGQDSLSDAKHVTNEIERCFMNNNCTERPRRLVNIDPGYLTLAKVVLASTKDYAHRIYIGKGIYAEGTLYYKDKTFQSNPHTYPDYGSTEYIAMFNEVRNRMMMNR